MTCRCCKSTLGITESYYNIRESYKPRGSANRWRKVGKCCEACYSNGQKLTLENF